MDWYLTAVKLLMTGYRQTNRAIINIVSPNMIFVFLLIRKNGRQVLTPASLTLT